MAKLPSLSENAHLSELFSQFPQSLDSMMAFTEVVMRAPGELDIADREFVAAYVSGLNACTFCFGSHAIYAEAFGIDPAELQLAVEDLDGSNLPAKMKVLLGYIAKLNTLPAKIVQSDIDAVLNVGFSEKALFEAVQIAGLFNMMNRIVEGTGVGFDYAADRSIHPTEKLGDRARQHSYTGTPMGRPR